MGAATGRDNQRAQTFQELGRAMVREAIALATTDAGHAPRFDNVKGPFTANTTPPSSAPVVTDAEILLGVGFNGIALYPEWIPAQEQAVVLHVWARDAADATLPWRRIAIVAFAGTTADIETVVMTGNRDVYVQVVSGADAGHPFTLHTSAF